MPVTEELLWPETLSPEDHSKYLSDLADHDPYEFRKQYMCEFYFDDENMKWVIPHGSSLDYCHVTILSPHHDGTIRVEGRRTEGWIRDGANIRTKVPVDMLTDTPSWHKDFLTLYDEPHDPRLKQR